MESFYIELKLRSENWLIICSYNPNKKTIVSQLEALTLPRMCLFDAAHGCGATKKVPLPKICHIHHAMMKLGTVIPYLKKAQKIYESRDTPLELLPVNTS